MADERNYLRIIMANYIRFKENIPDPMKWDKAFRVKNVGVTDEKRQNVTKMKIQRFFTGVFHHSNHYNIIFATRMLIAFAHDSTAR